MSLVWPALTFLFSTVSALAVARWLFDQWVGARIKGAVETQYAKEVEKYRAELKAQADAVRTEIETQRAVHAVATDAFAAAQRAAAERRLDAVRDTWNATLSCRRTASRLVGGLSFLTRDEVNRLLVDDKVRRLLPPISYDDVKEYLRAYGQIDPIRPFIDEPLWAAFFGYQAFLGRTTILLKMAHDRIEQVTYWLDDPDTRALLVSLLSAEVVKRIEEMKIGGFNEAQRLMETHILEEARRIVSGRSASDDAHRHALLILERAQAAQPAQAALHL